MVRRVGIGAVTLTLMWTHERSRVTKVWLREADAAMADERAIRRHDLDRLRAVCLDLPESYEESAWTGIRWCIRRRNFVHAVAIDSGWPPAYAEAVGDDGPVTVVTFRTATPDYFANGSSGPAYFWPGWFPNLAGRVLDATVDWDELGELLVESYCLLAPKKLVAQIDDRRPPAAT